MKTSVFLMMFVGLTLNYAALADTKSYSTDDIELINVISHCPDEFSTLAKKGVVAGAQRDSNGGIDTFSIGFLSPGTAPIGGYPLGRLEVVRTTQPGPSALDAPSIQSTFSCKIEYAR